MKRVHPFLLLLIFSILPVRIRTEVKRCDRTPEGHVAPKSPGDGRYRVRIGGNPEGYIPKQEYIIHLAGIRSYNQVVHKFIGFFLTVEQESADDFSANEYSSAGTFSLVGDNLSKFSDRCENAVTQATAILKGEIRVIWTAPEAGSGCVVFRSTVVEHRDVWFMDDEYLNKRFCEDEQDTIDKNPLINDPCCACEEAKYELTFERVWSRHTHNKDFPADALSTRFSDLIGASHTVDYRFWEYGKHASQGLRQVAEHGSTRELESELKTESENIRTIIKARGATHANATGKTFAVFRVDSKHHLISLVSMIMPSPDWIVGVSALELCSANCSWLETKKLNLYPWDAGSDSGSTYLSPDQPTNPPDVIRSIRTNFPNDPNSPFYDTTGTDMKPMAKLTITRQRLYDKNCDGNGQREDEYEINNACRTTTWSEWSECNVKCGRGKRRRSRKYLDPAKANLMGCQKILNERQECEGNEPYCDDHRQSMMAFETETVNRPECALTRWGEWSDCSVPCGRGRRTRHRGFVNRSKAKKCKSSSVHSVLLEETQDCEGVLCGGVYPNPQEIRAVESSRRCRTSQWSLWSPCSETCGLGIKVRTRQFLRDIYRLADQDDGELMNREGRPDDDDREECKVVPLREEVVCGRDRPTCNKNVDSMNQVDEFCFLTPESGHCRRPANRWFYMGARNDCILFSYSGCGGNQNNFQSREECLERCGRNFTTPENTDGRRN